VSFARWQPYYTDRELELDRRIHALGLLLALIATPFLLGLAAESRRPGLVLPCAIYLFSLLGMLGSSTLFRHTPLRWSNYRWFLRRLDHAAIFLFIAGTYTPFAVGQLGGEWVGPTVAVWAGALIGAAYKLAFPVGLRRPSLVAFAALASFVLFGLRPTLASMAPPAVGLFSPALRSIWSARRFITDRCRFTRQSGMVL
jgi:hemolysin III